MGSNTEESDRSVLGQLMDPNVGVTPGNVYYSSIEELTQDKSWKRKEVLSIGDVKELWKMVKAQPHSDSKRIHLNELLGGSNLNIPSLEIPERNPELEKRINALKNQLDEQEYRRMTKNVNQASSPYKASLQDDSIGSQMKQMNSAIFAALQFVISVAAAFFFGFTGVQMFLGPLELAVRLLLGIAAAVIVGAADLYFLLVYLDASEALQEKELYNTKGKLKIKEH